MRRLDTIYEPLLVIRETIDVPNVEDGDTVVVDTTATGVVLGSHIISWAPVTTATTIDDLIVTWMIVASDLIRSVWFNPTGSDIDPDSIDFEFVVGITVRSGVV